MSKEIRKYDEKSNCIYYKSSSDLEIWTKYDENNNLIYYTSSFGYEHWLKYGENNRRIEITEKEYKEIEFRKKEKEYNSRTKCSRFELIDI